MSFAPPRKSKVGGESNQAFKQLQEVKRQAQLFLQDLRRNHPSSKSNTSTSKSAASTTQKRVIVNRKKHTVSTPADFIPRSAPEYKPHLTQNYNATPGSISNQVRQWSLQDKTILSPTRTGVVATTSTTKASPALLLPKHPKKSSNKSVKIHDFGLHSAKLEPLQFNVENPVSGSTSAGGQTSLLTKDDQYFAQLQQFRDENPALFYRHFFPRSSSSADPRTEYSCGAGNGNRGRGGRDGKDGKQGYVYGGYYCVDDRYFLEEAKNPKLDDRIRKLLFQGRDEQPVKISIPTRRVQKVHKKLVAVCRKDYDPQDSVSLSQHLIKGYAPVHVSRPPKTAECWSWRHFEDKQRQREEMFY